MHYGPLILPEKALPLAQPLNSSLVLAGNAKPKKPKRKQHVLDEDTYVRTMDSIISRDYFPALEPLENLLTGARTHASVRRASVRSSVRSSAGGSFEAETPDIHRPPSPERPSDEPAVEGGEARPSLTKPDSLSLDQFTHNFTSEDNQSFEQLIEVEDKRREEKVFWLEENARQAANHIISRIQEPNRSGLLDSWTYSVKNSLMFYPSGEEVTQVAPRPDLPEKAIVPENTRFPGGFFDKPSKAVEAKLQETVPGTPMVNGHKLLRTPTPSLPAGEEIVTWGDIVGTPLHLKNEDDEPRPSAGTKEFRVPDTPSRDEILFKLDAQAKERSKKLTGSRRVPTSPLGSRTPTPMSPVIRAMLRANKGDAQLRASYSTPTPRTRSGSFTPTPQSQATPSTPVFARPAPRQPRAPAASPR